MKRIITLLTVLSVALSLALTAASESIEPAVTAVSSVAPDIAVLVDEPASSAGSQVSDKQLEAAVVVAKSRVKVSDDYTDFNFYKYNSNNSVIYNLQWSGEKGSLEISVQDDVILSYSEYINTDKAEDNDAHFAKMTKSQLKKAADKAIQELNPTVSKYIKVDTNTYSSYVSGETAYFNIKRYRNNVPVAGNSGSITLNKDTGELVRFYISWTAGGSFKSTKEALSREDIQKSYSDNVGLKPVYRIINEYNDNKAVQKAILVYLPKSSDKLDAFTGKISDFYSTSATNVSGEMAEEEDAVYDEAGGTGNSAPAVRLTPNELAAVEREKDFISASDAAKLVVNDKYSAFTDEYTLTSSYLRYDYYKNNVYYWELAFSGKNGNLYGNAQVNADTGEIISYYCYDYSGKTPSGELDEKAADTLVETALKSYLGKKFSEFTLSDSKVQEYTDYNTRKLIRSGKYYTYQRSVKDIEVEGNTTSVTVGLGGKITNYSMSYSDIKFPSPEKMLKEGDALSKLYSQQTLKLSYYTKYSNKKVSVALLYDMEGFTLDAFSGKLLDYSGAEIVDKSQSYTDIENHSIKKVADKLAENGIKITTTDGKLNPDSKITEEEFIRLTDAISKGGDFYPLYSSRLYNTSAKLGKTISRQNAVKCLITALGGREFAEIKGLYPEVFSDVKADSSYAGYFTLANGLNIFGKNASGAIKPAATITRAEALTMIYNYLINK